MNAEYNGWTNRETWATKLHIDNDQGLYEISQDYARTAWQEHEQDGEGRYATAAACLADTLENWFDDMAGDFTELTAGIYTMLRDIGSLYRVNWSEIAESMIEELALEAVNA
jgi:hypothetical protein